MKNSIYSKRIDLNNWEILGIQAYLLDNFDQNFVFIYSDKTIHLDNFGIYKISTGEDLYFTKFKDEAENITYRLNLSDDTFSEISENFEFISNHKNIFYYEN